jgi:hypothetical protein
MTVWYVMVFLCSFSTEEYFMNRKLNSDGQQFHQYQQNEQSPLSLTHWTQKDHDISHWYNKMFIVFGLHLYISFFKLLIHVTACL